ncbi:MAG: AzlC family ABC transporter permease [Desulfobacteraceae bacterium]
MTSANRREFLKGAGDTIPLILGAVPFGIIFGTLASGAGLSFEAVMGMSIFVFAGSAQFVAIGLVSQGAGWLVIVLTTLVVNLRHLLYAASLIPYYRKLSGRWKFLLSFGLTDETFAVAYARYREKDDSENKHIYNLGSMALMYLNWNLCTLVGLTIGKTVPGIEKWGLDFAMPATFIGMVIPYLVNTPMWAAVFTAGIFSVALNFLPHKLGLMAAALAGVTAGMICDSLNRRQGVKHG